MILISTPLTSLLDHPSLPLSLPTPNSYGLVSDQGEFQTQILHLALSAYGFSLPYPGKAFFFFPGYAACGGIALDVTYMIPVPKVWAMPYTRPVSQR